MDLVALARDGAVIVIELKRGNDPRQLLQGIAYAAVIAKWSATKPAEVLGQFAKITVEAAQSQINDYLNPISLGVNTRQRVLLVAESFDAIVLATAEWLVERYGVELRCHRVALHVDGTCELYPRVGFIVTNMTRPAERVVMFYNHRGTAELWIKEGKNAVNWTRLSCHRFAANAVRLQLHGLAYNLANFLRTLALPETVKQWSMTILRDRLVKIGARIVRHGRSITFQMAEVMVSRALFRQILVAIAALRPLPSARC